MRAGLLTELLSFYKKVESRDLYGSALYADELVCKKRAAVKYLNGGVKDGTFDVVNSSVQRFTLRYCTDVDDTMVIVWRDSRYDIVSVDFDKVDMSLIVLARFKEKEKDHG